MQHTNHASVTAPFPSVFVCFWVWIRRKTNNNPVVYERCRVVCAANYNCEFFMLPVAPKNPIRSSFARITQDIGALTVCELRATHHEMNGQGTVKTRTTSSSSTTATTSMLYLLHMNLSVHWHIRRTRMTVIFSCCVQLCGTSLGIRCSQ